MRAECVDEDGQQVDTTPCRVFGVMDQTVKALERAADGAAWTPQGLQCLETGLRLLCRVRQL